MKDGVDYWLLTARASADGLLAGERREEKSHEPGGRNSKAWHETRKGSQTIVVPKCQQSDQVQRSQEARIGIRRLSTEGANLRCVSLKGYREPQRTMNRLYRTRAGCSPKQSEWQWQWQWQGQRDKGAMDAGRYDGWRFGVCYCATEQWKTETAFI